jgi:hypothetical protein
MSNDWFEAPTPLARGTTARAAQINSRMAALEAAFDLFPDRLPLLQNRVTYLEAGGTADALTVTLDPAVLAYVEGLGLRINIASTNTGAATVNVNGLGNKSIKRPDGTALQAGDLTAGNVVDLVYDGTNFKILGSGIVAAQAAAAVTSAAAAAVSAAAAAASATSAANSATAAAASAAAAAASAASLNVSSFVHNTGAEAIGGVKTFSNTPIFSAGITINSQTLSSLTAGGKAVAEITGAADKGIYFTSASAAATFDLTSFGRSLIDDASASAARTTLGVATFDLMVVIDGGGAAITTGVKCDFHADFAFTITGWTVLLDQSGSIVVDVWKDTYANYPPTGADTIAGTEKPTVAAATKGQDATLTSFSGAVAAGDTLRFNVDSATTAQRATIIFRCVRA